MLFGRHPSSGEPGELAVETKWESVRAAVARLFDSERPVEWSLVDVRWDRPELRGAPLLASLSPEPRRTAPVDRNGPAGHSARADRPTVH